MPASGVVFAGADVKALKQNINLNGLARLATGTADPSAVATFGPAGSLYLQLVTGSAVRVFQKEDAGTTTNWRRLDILPNGEFNDQVSSGSFSLNGINGLVVNYTINTGDTVTLTANAFWQVEGDLVVDGDLVITDGTVRIG